MPLVPSRSHLTRRHVLSAALVLSAAVGWIPIAVAAQSDNTVGLFPISEARSASDAAASTSIDHDAGDFKAAEADSPRSEPAVNAWRAWEGRHFRLTAGGDISCYSEDGEHCSTRTPDSGKEARTINCAMPQKELWRTLPGYQRLDHWCNIAYANLFAKWVSYEPLGYPVVLATNPRGDVMCKSLDGTSCLAPGEHRSDRSRSLNPVVCGRQMRERANFSGYDDPNHWCSSPELLLRDKPLLKTRRSIHTDRRQLSRDHEIELKRWSAQEVPTWIVRFRVPEPWHAGVELMIGGWDTEYVEPYPTYSRPSLGWHRTASLGAAATSGVTAHDFKSHHLFRRQLLDSKGRGVLAIRVDKTGRVRFFQAPGWRGFQALEAYELDPWNTWRQLQFFRWTESPRTWVTVIASLHRSGGQRRFDESDLRDPPLPVIKDVLVTRQRPTPPPY
ncbi:hypothetical protein CDN99_03020 [Roseateles aquatilis]|uniref:Uncharacterized protein n=1 Tax=Roseateles aquatilis TaxID=431061 RepID=A0A246JLN3_9BURK|nr:hypothetical protein [Roseateles aquatilis]OWQ93460.1 hypothetical protein CDN99_03020 [Roseateles aquatilis]